MSAAVTRKKQREIVTINCGGCGVNVGSKLLQSCAADVGIGMFGEKERETLHDGSEGISFAETSKQKYVARSLFIDADRNSLQTATSPSRFQYSALIDGANLIHGDSGDCGGNYAIGQYEIAPKLIGTIMDRLRYSIEACDNLQGLVFNHSMSGGSAGILQCILEKCAETYRKKTRFACNILFDEERCQSKLEIYNALLNTNNLLNEADVVVTFDNQQVRRICSSVFKDTRVSYAQLNAYIAKTVNMVTAPARLGINGTLSTLQADMSPFPRLHFLYTATQPLLSKNNQQLLYASDVQTLCNACLEPRNFSIRCDDFDVEEDRVMAMAFFLRGPRIDRYVSHATAAMRFLSTNRKFRAVEWLASDPFILKFINTDQARSISHSGGASLMRPEKEVTALMNNLCISRLFSERIARKFDLLFAGNKHKCLYLHHLTSHGMETTQLEESRENLGFMEKDYLDVISEVLTDDDDDDDDDDY